MDKPTAGDIVGEEGVSAEHMAAYTANYNAHRVGITASESLAYYEEFAGKYEETISGDTYQGHIYAADTAKKYLGNKLEAKILDVAAGTGFVGEQLIRRGFTNVDALEPSAMMLKGAGKKAIYKRLICNFLAANTPDIEDDTYDCLVVAGGMGEGHIPCSAIPEMLRVVRPGGYVIIVMREEYLSYVKDYVDRLEPLTRELEACGKWKREERTPVSNYSFGKDGLVFVWRVFQQGLGSFQSTIL